MPMNRAGCIQQAVNYIEAHLAEDISLYDVAGSAGFSVPHFYRVFKALTGRTVGVYVLKRRLSLAACALCSGSRTVAEIAYEHGFGSHDVFTRAFIREYGMTPSRYRKNGIVQVNAPLAADIPTLEEKRGKILFEIVHKAEFQVTGMRCSAMEWDADGAIGRLWSAFLPQAEEIRGRSVPAVMYGICESGHAEPDRFSYLAAVGVLPGAVPPAGMDGKRLRAQTYMQARVPECVSVPDAYTQTLGYARECGYAIEDYDYIELYDETFQDPADHSFQLLIPVK